MITKDTHKIDWNKTTQVAGVVLMVMAKGAWWTIRHVGIFLFTALTMIAKILVAIVSVWASLPDNSNTSKERNDPSRALDPDNPGHDMMGRPINIHRNYF